MYLSTCWASSGMVSLSWIPSTLVLKGLNSPRMFEGASGLGSQMSMWLGSPCRNSRMTDFALPYPFGPSNGEPGAALASSEKNWGKLSPNRVAPPTRRNSRREYPSHILEILRGIDSITHLRSRVLGDACTKPRLLIEQEGVAVQQRPFQILNAGRSIGSCRDVRLCLMDFLRARRAVECRHVQVISNRVVGRTIENQFGDA